MILSQHLLPDRQCLLEVRTRFLIVLLKQEHPSEVVQTLSNLRMPFTKHLLADRQRPLEVPLRHPSVAASSSEQLPQVVEARGRFEALLTMNVLVDLQRPLEVVLCLSA